MSADNWAICPQCKKIAIGNRVAEEVRVAAMYGVAPVEEFEAAREAIAQPLDFEIYRTLREDYDIGVDEDGEFYADYAGGCNACGFAHQFKERKQLVEVPSP